MACIVQALEKVRSLKPLPPMHLRFFMTADMEQLHHVHIGVLHSARQSHPLLLPALRKLSETQSRGVPGTGLTKPACIFSFHAQL